ncbi:hypothetical protein [Nocardioides sp.]|uniref:hypothetical protein n=1 Tax=Nocardioides sp. TaxID=35761 RepID=UPI0035160638
MAARRTAPRTGARGRAARLAAAAVVWLVVVSLAGTLVWTVISRVGREVSTGESVLRAPEPTRTMSPPTTTGPPSGRRTWSGRAGTVVAACTGARIELVQAVPSADGYAVEVKQSGGAVVEVEFEGRVEEAGRETTVVGRCRDGVPVYTTEVE